MNVGGTSMRPVNATDASYLDYSDNKSATNVDTAGNDGAGTHSVVGSLGTSCYPLSQLPINVYMRGNGLTTVCTATLWDLTTHLTYTGYGYSNLATGYYVMGFYVTGIPTGGGGNYSLSVKCDLPGYNGPYGGYTKIYAVKSLY